MNKTSKLIPFVLAAALISNAQALARTPSCLGEALSYGFSIGSAKNAKEKEKRLKEFSNVLRTSTQEKRCCLWNGMVRLVGKGNLRCKKSHNTCRNIAVDTTISIATANTLAEKEDEIRKFKNTLILTPKAKRCCIYNAFLEISGKKKKRIVCSNTINPTFDFNMLINNSNNLFTGSKFTK